MTTVLQLREQMERFAEIVRERKAKVSSLDAQYRAIQLAIDADYTIRVTLAAINRVGQAEGVGPYFEDMLSTATTLNDQLTTALSDIDDSLMYRMKDLRNAETDYANAATGYQALVDRDVATITQMIDGLPDETNNCEQCGVELDGPWSTHCDNCEAKNADSE